MIPNMTTVRDWPLMTPQGVRARMTGRPALLKWAPFLIVNNYTKFEENILSKDRDTRKRLILRENSKSKRDMTVSKNFEGDLRYSYGFPF